MRAWKVRQAFECMEQWVCLWNVLCTVGVTVSICSLSTFVAARLIATVADELRVHKATLHMVFPFYCRLEKFSNREYLGNNMWRKLAMDSGLVERPRDNAMLDLVFAVGVKSNPATYTEKKLTFEGFLAAFASLLIHKRKVNATNAHAVVTQVMADNVSKLRRLEEVCDTSELRTAKAAAVLQHERSLVQVIFMYYADPTSRHTRIMRDHMFQFARDFNITPRLCSRTEMHDIVATAVGEEHGVTFPAFLECIGMIAVTGFTKLHVGKKKSTGAKKLTELFKWLRLADKLQEVEVKQHTWGKSRSGRNLNREQVSGEAVASPRRRISIANKGQGGVDMAAIARRRRSTVTSIGSRRSIKSADEEDNTPIRFGLCLAAPEIENPSHQPDPKISVDQKLLDRLLKATLRLSGRVKPVFDFYCRLGDPSNRGFMSFLNFRRLLRDCEAMDDIVNANMVNLQVWAAKCGAWFICVLLGSVHGASHVVHGCGYTAPDHHSQQSSGRLGERAGCERQTGGSTHLAGRGDVWWTVELGDVPGGSVPCIGADSGRPAAVRCHFFFVTCALIHTPHPRALLHARNQGLVPLLVLFSLFE